MPPTYSSSEPLSDEEAALAAFDAEFPHIAAFEAEQRASFTPSAIVQHERWQQRLASDDPYAKNVGRAAERWQAGEDSLRRDLRRLKAAYNAAIGRGDSKAAHQIDRDIQVAREALRIIRSQS